MQIAYLADHPQYLHTLVDWIYDQWGRNTPGSSLASVEGKFRTHQNTRQIPTTLIALADAGTGEAPALLGTASLVEADLRSRPELTPWLAAVYVPPDQRRHGVGAALVQAAEQNAARLGVQKLYLFTEEQEQWYARMGWHTIDHETVRGQLVPIMEKLLTADF